jgi:hypothetical protein
MLQVRLLGAFRSRASHLDLSLVAGILKNFVFFPLVSGSTYVLRETNTVAVHALWKCGNSWSDMTRWIAMVMYLHLISILASDGPRQYRQYFLNQGGHAVSGKAVISCCRPFS